MQSPKHSNTGKSYNYLNLRTFRSLTLASVCTKSCQYLSYPTHPTETISHSHVSGKRLRILPVSLGFSSTVSRTCLGLPSPDLGTATVYAMAGCVAMATVTVAMGPLGLSTVTHSEKKKDHFMLFIQTAEV